MCVGDTSGGGDDKYGERTRDPMSNQTYKSADSFIGRVLGDNRSDQQIANDQRQTEAIERGDDTFELVEGGRGMTAGYRNTVAPQAGSFLANLNSPPTVGGFAGFGTSSLIGGPLGFAAGQAVRLGVNTLLGDRATLGGRR